MALQYPANYLQTLHLTHQVQTFLKKFDAVEMATLDVSVNGMVRMFDGIFVVMVLVKMQRYDLNGVVCVEVKVGEQTLKCGVGAVV